MMTPVELHYAFEDWEHTHFTPMKRICETIRMVGVTTHNSATGRKRHHMIKDPKRWLKFGWENKPKIQTVEEMKSFIMGLNHMKGVTIKQNGEVVKDI